MLHLASDEQSPNLTDPTLPAWQTAYCGTNVADLVRVKNKYDPDNVFQFPQSIPLST
jgi:hypothetical protein